MPPPPFEEGGGGRAGLGASLDPGEVRRGDRGEGTGLAPGREPALGALFAGGGGLLMAGLALNKH